MTKISAEMPFRSKTIVIMQPYFLPYRNYYGLIQKADQFVVFDDVQFCRKWQQRNMILWQNKGKKWLTIPIISERPNQQLIRDVRVCNRNSWSGKMLALIRQSYKNHPHFDSIYPDLENFLKKKGDRLVDITVPLLWWSASEMGIRLPKWSWSSELGGKELNRTERLVYICQRLDATEYLVGPAAKTYLDENLFETVGIRVIWHEDNYPDYPQLISQKFDHYISALDLLMNCGVKSINYIKP